MPESEPSFANLYRRSHFSRDDEDDEGQEAKKRRDRKEEFAVAAVAFVLKHDPSFKKYFIECICGETNSTDFRPIVQPFQCSDLALCSGDSNTLVLEFKIKAKLEPHQDPDDLIGFKNREKTKDKKVGYAVQFFEKFPKTREFRYVVIQEQQQFETKDVPFQANGAIHCTNRTWSEIAKMEKPTDLVEDLFNSLADLGVTGMKARKLRGKKCEATEDASLIIQIIREIAVGIGIKSNDFRIDADNDANAFWIGMNIPADLKGFEKLSEVVQTRSNLIGWFGYEGKNRERAKASIWLYSSEASTDETEKLLTKLPLRRELVEKCHWRLTGDAVESGGDFEWFERAFKTLKEGK